MRAQKPIDPVWRYLLSLLQASKINRRRMATQKA
jgi:hypothetical protein